MDSPTPSTPSRRSLIATAVSVIAISLALGVGAAFGTDGGQFGGAALPTEFGGAQLPGIGLILLGSAGAVVSGRRLRELL
ncbi:MAG TPA: hypothetical protein VJA85_08405 [Candidatus Limnocylindria bacterium]|nr:hypothetical protein [Candidatus Limnocylindria bacterium]